MERMPPIPDDAMTDVQRAAAEALRAGPRKGVKGPFIPLMRSPELMSRLQRVGEYLRFDNSLPARLSEFATLVVARAWTQQFEWAMHVPLALKAGTSPATIDALREGRRPSDMSQEEALVHDFTVELATHRGVSDATYSACVARLGEQGVIDLVGLVGYFTMISMVLNVARTPPEPGGAIAALPPLPLA